jgi:hypothetical protein
MAFLKDTLWDYVPGEFLVKQAGGTIYNEKELHIATNDENFLSMITLILASVIMLYKTIKGNCWIRNYIRIVTWILIILQSMSVYFIVSLII